jgi:putative endonuclease
MYYIYMLRCEDNSIYTGITTNIERRMKEHFEKDKKCAKYTFTHSAKSLEALWKTENKSLASKLEFNIKKLRKQEKEELIKKKDLKKYLSNKIEVEKYELIKNFTNIE